MKQTALGISPDCIRKEIRSAIIRCGCVFALTAAVCVALLLLRNERSHNLLLAADIVVSLIGCWYLVWYVTAKILPLRRLLRLDSMPETELSGTVDEISEQSERYFGFDCTPVKIGGRRLFVINNGNISLRAGEEVTVLTSHGIVKEVRS